MYPNTNDQLLKVLHNPVVAGRLILWAIELSEFVIEYALRKAIKAYVVAKVLANFIEGLEDELELELQDKIYEVSKELEMC